MIFIRKKYDCKNGRNFEDFNFSEVLVIPQELFIDENGRIDFSVQAGGQGSGIQIYYKVLGETVMFVHNGF